MNANEITCVPIVGARSIEQLNENTGALNLTMSSDQHDRITHGSMLPDPVSPYTYT